MIAVLSSSVRVDVCRIEDCDESLDRGFPDVIRCSLKTLGHKTIAEHDSILQQIVSRSLGNCLMDECGFIYILYYIILWYFMFYYIYIYIYIYILYMYIYIIYIHVLISTRFTRFCHCSVLGKGVSTWTSGAGVNAVELACSYLLLGLQRFVLAPDTSSMFPCFKTTVAVRKSCGCRIVVDPFCGSAFHVHTASHGQPFRAGSFELPWNPYFPMLFPFWHRLEYNHILTKNKLVPRCSKNDQLLAAFWPFPSFPWLMVVPRCLKSPYQCSQVVKGLCWLWLMHCSSKLWAWNRAKNGLDRRATWMAGGPKGAMDGGHGPGQQVALGKRASDIQSYPKLKLNLLGNCILLYYIVY